MKYEEFKKYVNDNVDVSMESDGNQEEGVFSYGRIRPRIFYRVISALQNEELLRRCPHVRLFDMAITFRWLFHQDERGISSALIQNDHLEYWEVDEVEMIRAALWNTPRLFPVKRCKILEAIRQWVDLGGPDLPLYVLTNDIGINGAATIFYPGALEAFAQEVGQDFYILPSSIHEVLLIAKSEVEDSRDLKDMVWEVNRTVVSERERLSDQVLYYDWKKEEVRLLES